MSVFRDDHALPDTSMRLSDYVLQTFLVNIFSLAIANFSIFKMANGNFKMAAKFTCKAERRPLQSVTCLATDACLTAYPGVASPIPARYHTFVEIDHEIISTVILLPSADLFKKGCCQLQAKVCAQITG